MGEDRWRREMGLMMDAFGWSSEEWSRATAHEIHAVIEARQRAHKR